MSAIRVGIVGVGFAGKFHYEALRTVHGVDVEVVGATSKTKRGREAFAAERHIKAFDSVETLLDEVDLLDICSPPYVHETNILAACQRGKHVICEKPLTGYFGPEGADEAWRGDVEPKAPVLEEVRERLERIAGAVRKAGVMFGYAENFVYAPTVQKEREVIQKTNAQLLRMTGEESHSGSGSPVYGIWRCAGGGSLMGKGCHPLTALLYLKRVEGETSGAGPIRPRCVTARTHQLTRVPRYRDLGFIRTDYHDIEDYGWMHVVFEDGTVADVVTGETTLGGCYDYLEIFANNHRTRCRISPTNLLDLYNPRAEQFKDIYTVEKISTKEGWSPAAPDENWSMGYTAEMQDFLTCAVEGREPVCGMALAVDTMLVIYAAYLSDERKGAEVAIG
ncbi:MAG TPA: Gfo/Idh/MocA family oxidoreductase [Planctomycetota bacterium]|nr:Gfo/Idh/MocA family oxidoreductase [Planctomycetota bacterium]